MKKSSLRAARLALAIVVVAAPTLTVVAAPARDRERSSDKGAVIVRVVKKISKAFGITTNNDLPAPPWPNPNP